MTHQLHRSLVRVWGREGAVVGAGFLVGEREVLTCAHVVALALGLPHDTPPSSDEILVDFPLCGEQPARIPAVVAQWVPEEVPERGDIAGLVLLQACPAAAEPVMLVSVEEPWGHEFRTYGFPEGAPRGDWGWGVLRDTVSTGWLQIESVEQKGRRIQRGFSGAPVWVDDDALRGVVGMVVAADQRDGDRVGYAIPASVLRTAWPAVLAPRIRAACPYRGLRAFREQDAELFCGRDEEVARLVEAVRRQPLVAVLGSSGSGKSSLVFAGLLPALLRDDRGLLTASFQPRHDPFGALAAALLPLLEPDLGEASRLKERSVLAGRLREGQLPAVIEQILDKTGAQRVLLVADQFEKLYSERPDEASARQAEVAERHAFLDALVLPVLTRRSALTVVLTMRADFYPRALEHRAFGEALERPRLNLGAMIPEQLRRAIEEPARSHGIAFADGLVDRILADVGEGAGRLPLLEFALTRLWERQRHGRLPHDGYSAIGGVEGALTQYAEEVYQSLSEAEQARVRRVFGHLVAVSDALEPTGRVALRAEIPAEDWAVVQRLADRRLVVTDRDPGERETERETAQVAHEALIAGWARLREWVAADRDFLSWREQVRAAVRLWEASHRDESDLLRGKRLADAERWCSDRAEEVDERVVEFVRESRRGEAGELMVRAGDSLHHGMRAEAIAGYERASAILQELGDRKRQLSVLDEIIRLHLKAGEPERAETIAGYERASAILQELGDRKRQLEVLRTLVRLHLKADAPQLAMHRYREILELLGPEARSNETTLMLSLIAQIAAQRKEDPLPWYLKALTTHREVGERHGEAETESRLANLYLRKRKVDQALRHAAGALRLYRERGEQRPVDSLLWTLLWTQGLRGETVAATRCYWEMARLGQAELAAELTNMTRWYHKWFFKLSVRLVLTLLAFLVVSGPLIWFASYGIGIAALDRIFAHRYHAFGTTIGFGVDVRWVSRTVIALGAVALAWMVGGGLMRVLLATIALLTLCEGWLWLLDASGHNLLLQALSVTLSVLLLRWLVLRTRWTLIRPYTRKLRVAARWVRHATVDRWIAEEATFWEPSASPALLPPAHRRDR